MVVRGGVLESLGSLSLAEKELHVSGRISAAEQPGSIHIHPVLFSPSAEGMSRAWHGRKPLQVTAATHSRAASCLNALLI